MSTVLNEGTVAINNAYGEMTIGDASTIGSTAVYSGSSCLIISNNVSKGRFVVCSGKAKYQID